MKPDKYILKGKVPVVEPDLLKWARWLEKNDRHVAKTYLWGYRVSTIFLGLDHNFSENGPPLLFVTMVFPHPGLSLKEILRGKSEPNKFEDIQERYSTWDEAERGHRRIVAKVIKEG